MLCVLNVKALILLYSLHYVLSANDDDKFPPKPSQPDEAPPKNPLSRGECFQTMITELVSRKYQINFRLEW